MEKKELSDLKKSIGFLEKSVRDFERKYREILLTNQEGLVGALQDVLNKSEKTRQMYWVMAILGIIAVLQAVSIFSLFMLAE